MSKKTVDLALIQPPGWSAQTPPMGLALLKSYLTGQGYNVKTLDLNIILYNIRHGQFSIAWELENAYSLWEKESYVKQLFYYYKDDILQFIYTVLAMEPEIIGFSTHCSSHISARLLAEKFRQVAPEKKIIFGGPQVAYYSRSWLELLTTGTADAVFFSEGEESLSEFLRSKNDLGDRPLSGMAYTGTDGDVIDGKKRAMIPKLDTLPFADYSDFDLMFYAGVNVLPTYFSRGCVNKCIFCTENKFFPKFRNRSGQRVFDEVIHQLTLYPRTEYFRFYDSISNGNIRELENFCDLIIKNKINIGFNLENAVIRQEMTPRLYKKLKKAGCTLIGYGLETPSKRLLRKIGKTACLKSDIDKVVTDGVKAKMIIGINMMFGLPGEEESDFQQQLDFIKKHRRSRKRIVLNPALNYCYFPEGSAVSTDPGQYGIDTAGGELFWSAADGTNTFLDRIDKFERFCSAAAKLGYANMFNNITESVNKEEMLGHYYRGLGNLDPALKHLKNSFTEEFKTTEVADDIIALYDQLALKGDEFYDAVKSYKLETSEVSTTFIDKVSNRGELESFVLATSIADTAGRLNAIIESLRDPSAKLVFSRHGLKNYIRHIVAKLMFVSDKKYFILVQLLIDLDNKVDALNYRNSNRSR